MRRSRSIGWDAAAAPAGGTRNVKPGYRLMLVDRDGVLVSEFQLTEKDLAEPEAFVAAIKQSVENVEDEEP